MDHILDIDKFMMMLMTNNMGHIIPILSTRPSGVIMTYELKLKEEQLTMDRDQDKMKSNKTTFKIVAHIIRIHSIRPLEVIMMMSMLYMVHLHMEQLKLQLKFHMKTTRRKCMSLVLTTPIHSTRQPEVLVVG